MDSLRYWVTEMHVDGFRFDLAATLAREFYDVDRLSRSSTSSSRIRREPGQADRRAVGRRARRLPGRQLSAAVDGMERQVPRHRPRLLARRSRDARRVRLPVHRLGRSVRAAPARRSRRSTSSPPTTASRCAISSPTTRSTTKPTARTIATARATTGRGTAAPKDRPTIPASTHCGRASSATSLATLLLSQGVPMISHGDELGRTQHGNNNGSARTTSSPGSTGRT